MSRESKRNSFKWYLGSVVGMVLLLVLFWGSDCDNSTPGIYSNPTGNSTPIIPDSLTFCGELVPTHYFDVHEALERELLVNTYWHSQTILLIKKANRYFPEIEPILKANGIPDDFKYLAVAESGFSHVVSPSGAVGFWQLLEGTAKDYKLEVNDEVDERYNLTKATEAACNYISESYSKYKNWALSAASYNIGRRGIDRQIDKQKETNYYDLLLNEETARYVYRIIALKLVIENPTIYNFEISEKDLYKPISYTEVKVDTAVSSWADFAHSYETNYKMLKTLNPWLRDQKLTNKLGKEYVIRIPRKKSRNK